MSESKARLAYLLAESLQEQRKLALALRCISDEAMNMQPTIAQLAEHLTVRQRINFIDNHIEVIHTIACHALKGTPHGLGESHPYVVGLQPRTKS